MIKRISGVAIATESIAVMAEFYKSIGLEVQSVETLKDQKIKVAVMKMGETTINLIEPTDESSPLARFLEEKGEGIHHITLQVDDITGQLEYLKELNVALIDEKPRIGTHGSLVAFIGPESTGGVLIELCQVGSEEE
jgi:methylmalonyl-CoA/ethylmalonyl-CoA epimerase